MYSTPFRRLCSSAFHGSTTINPSSLHHLKITYNINPCISTPIRSSFRLSRHLTFLMSRCVYRTKCTIHNINKIFLTHPIIAGSLFSGIKTELADLFAQTKIENKCMSDIDWSRNFLFFLFGTFYCGAVSYFVLVKFYPYLFPMNNRSSVICKVLFDQFITTPFLYFPTFYSCKCLVFEKQSFGYQKWKEYQQKYWTENFKQDVLSAASIWGPTHLITFTLIPNHLKLLWIGCVSAAWTVVLSLLRGANDEIKEEEQELVEEEELVYGGKVFQIDEDIMSLFEDEKPWKRQEGVVYDMEML